MDVDASIYGAGHDKTPKQNSEAAEKAMAAVSNAGGGTVILPGGHYATTIAVPSNVTIQGAGVHAAPGTRIVDASGDL